MISIRKDLSIKESIENVLRELNFNLGKRIFIKPNLSGRFDIIPGENTSVEVMDALLDILLENGAKEILIGHGAILGSIDHQVSFDTTLKESGFIKYLNFRKEVKIINLDDQKREKIKIGKMIFHLPLGIINEVDSYINLAKIKTHMETEISFSLKNQMGLPAPVDRVMMHKFDLEKNIAELATIIKPDLSILEGFPAMEGNGPHHGRPRALNIIVAGDDMVELDSFVSLILGFNPEEIRHLKIAQELGVGNFFEKEKLINFQDYFILDFKKASKVYRFGLRMFAFPTFSCSRCINAVNTAGKTFKKNPLKYNRVIWKSLFSRKKINVIFGKADELNLSKNDKFICIGSCSKKFATKYGTECLDKCPPRIDETRDFIVKNI